MSMMGKAIVMARREKGWSQVDLACNSETSLGTIVRIESGLAARTKIGTMFKVLDALGISRTYFFNLND